CPLSILQLYSLRTRSSKKHRGREASSPDFAPKVPSGEAARLFSRDRGHSSRTEEAGTRIFPRWLSLHLGAVGAVKLVPLPGRHGSQKGLKEDYSFAEAGGEGKGGGGHDLPEQLFILDWRHVKQPSGPTEIFAKIDHHFMESRKFVKKL